MPGGICRIAVCEMAVTCACAALMFTKGWKKILITHTPFSVCDSICSMSLTVVDRLRS